MTVKPLTIGLVLLCNPERQNYFNSISNSKAPWFIIVPDSIIEISIIIIDIADLAIIDTAVK